MYSLLGQHAKEQYHCLFFFIHPRVASVCSFALLQVQFFRAKKHTHTNMEPSRWFGVPYTLIRVSAQVLKMDKI